MAAAAEVQSHGMCTGGQHTLMVACLRGLMKMKVILQPGVHAGDNECQ